MKDFFAAQIFGVGRAQQDLAGYLRGINRPNTSLPESVCDSLSNSLKNMTQNCEYFDLPASKEACEELVTVLRGRDPMPRYAEIQSLFNELNKRMEVELKAHAYLCISRDAVQFYRNPLDKWGETIAAFPSTRYDIEEASKCFALGRNTSSVFHLMRVMGAGITALGKTLNEPTLDASHNLTWDNVLRRCAKEGAKEFGEMSPVWKTDKQFYAEATAKLFAVKDAWRNPNAHEVGQKYTDEEAEDIYRTIRSFMRHLATKPKESP